MPKQPAWQIDNETLKCAIQCIAAKDPEARAREFALQLIAGAWEQGDVDGVIKDALWIVGHARGQSPDAK
jgi:hypothetical protein